jgi:hypothetical protein
MKGTACPFKHSHSRAILGAGKFYGAFYICGLGIGALDKKMELNGREDFGEIFGALGLSRKLVRGNGLALFSEDTHYIGREAGHHGEEEPFHGAGGGICASHLLGRIK